jgi:type II secretory pathway pseudopilin PulG
MKKLSRKFPSENRNGKKRSINKKNDPGYMMLILVFAVAVLTIGLMVAVPVWQTQIQREKEEELIFRGKQYVEAIRLFQQKIPGAFPQSFDDLIKEKCIRRLYKDPLTKSGEWNVILHHPGNLPQQGSSAQKVLIASQEDLDSMDHPQIIGVVSPSTQKSKKIYMEQDTYDKWLFYFGQDPNSMPEIVYFKK